MENKKRVIFYLIDGARPDILNKLVAQDELPNISKYMIDEGSYVKGTTCFPSTTGPAYLPFLTGASPGDHHITGIRWFDKEQYFKGRWGRNAMRSYCGYEAKYFNDDMNPSYPSLFETYEHGYNIYNMVTKGVRDENDVTAKGKSKLYFDAHFKHLHHKVDKLGHEKLMNSIENDFEFIFAVFPSIDWDSHTYHFEDPKTIDAYRLVDNSLGELVAKLKSLNKYEDTLIVMASDHGLTSTHTHLDLGKFFKKNGYRVLEYPSVWSIFPKVAVFISGNSFATLTFLDQKQLYYKEALFAKHGKVIQNLMSDPAIDFIVMRRSESSLAVLNESGEAEILIKDDRVKYTPQSGDPFGLGDTGDFLDDEASFAKCFESDYPDALFQCKQLFASERTGDIVVSANVGYDLRDFWEIPEHKGSHGSLHKDHMHVPILMNKPVLNNSIRTKEVYSIIRQHLDN